MNEHDILQRTRAYVQEGHLYMRPGFVLRDGDSLFATGVIDSMGVVELIGFLRDAFGVEVLDDEISDRNLGTLADISRFVTSKLRNGPKGVTS